jgi:hypothetical protein
MKFSLIVAALAFSAQAFDPKDIPDSMRDMDKPRYSGEGR